MSPDNDLFISLLILVSLVACVIAVMALYMSRRTFMESARLRRIQALQETAILSLRGALTALFAEESGQEERQERIERCIRDISDRQESQLMRDPETRPYAQAINMVRKGVGVETIIENCGLTRGEADLIASLHGKAAGEGPVER